MIIASSGHTVLYKNINFVQVRNGRYGIGLLSKMNGDGVRTNRKKTLNVKA